MSLSDAIQNIYIELDAILDTRLGVLWQMDSKKAEGLLYNGYHQRQIDNFSLLDSTIDHNEYLANYAKRNVETLKVSRLTNLVYLINRISIDLEDEGLRGPKVDGVEVTVNIYPYDLSAVEADVLKDSVQSHLGLMTGVNVISEPLTSLTPKVIKDKYSAIILYNFRDWISKLNPDDLVAHKFPTIRVIAPAIYEHSIPTEKDLLDDNKRRIDPFAELEIETLQFFSLVMTDIRFFSIVETT